MTALAEIISEVRGALGVGVEVLKDHTMLAQLPNGNDGLPADVGVLQYHSIRSSKLALDAVVSGLFGVSCPSLEVTLRRAEKIKFEKYSEEVRSRPDIRFILLRSWNSVLSVATPRLLRHNWLDGQPLKRCMWASCSPLGAERFLSPSMSLTRKAFCLSCMPPQTVWRPLLPCSAGMPSHAMALFTRSMGRKRSRASSTRE
jgi:hypothetical protein